MPTHSAHRRKFPTITEPSFNIGRLALAEKEDRLEALDDFMKSPAHQGSLSWRLHRVKQDSLTIGDLYLALQRVVEKGAVRFPSRMPWRMRLHWDRMLIQQICFLRKNTERSARRYDKRIATLCQMQQRQPEGCVAAPEESPDVSVSSFDAACADLRELIAYVEPLLTTGERFRLHALLNLMRALGRMPSQREIARAAGCSKTSIATLLIKIRELAPHHIEVRQGAGGSY